MNIHRIANARKITVITKENPWKQIKYGSKALEYAKSKGVSFEVIQLSWKASEEWKIMAEKGHIKYKNLGSLFSTFCVAAR